MKHPIAEADERSPFGRLTAEEFYERHGVSQGSSSFFNSRNLRNFTQWWIPLPSTAPVIGIVAVVHGYTVQLTAVNIAKAGFAVCAIDHQGHGYSDGLVAHIPDVNPVVDDCISFFDSFRAWYPSSLPCFLYSESLGSAIALLIHLRSAVGASGWDGAVLNGTMCWISAKFKPPWPLEHLLWLAAAAVPTWQVVPTRGSIPEVSFKVEWKRQLAIASPNRPKGRPRATTAQELLRVCREVQSRFEEITMPLLIVHGGDDVVCAMIGMRERCREEREG
ncbi:hypothetical protein AXF42_Ash006991 [Apostasia shenzhenica]|uniref:Serine aminopeptidase S33 domain-containing protein n=1 Tax=Apostasia shenzhenica TaxID=1088818 RepID=A0A2I0BET8_9ASPA|nr:hypothetical protein AXF42_Ash006991 [Apostasia shenzhenica]